MRLAAQSQFIPLQNVVYFIKLPFFIICKIFTFYINDVLKFKRSSPGPKGLTKLGWGSQVLNTVHYIGISSARTLVHEFFQAQNAGCNK